jgi:hypothetical protein
MQISRAKQFFSTQFRSKLGKRNLPQNRSLGLHLWGEPLTHLTDFVLMNTNAQLNGFARTKRSDNNVTDVFSDRTIKFFV